MPRPLTFKPGGNFSQRARLLSQGEHKIAKPEVNRANPRISNLWALPVVQIGSGFDQHSAPERMQSAKFFISSDRFWAMADELRKATICVFIKMEVFGAN